MKKNNFFFFLSLFLINLVVVFFFELEITFQKVLVIHTFLFSLLFLTKLIQKKISKHKNISSSLLLSINFLRILACILFLIPFILNHEKTNICYIYNFFCIYFSMLFSDIFLKLKDAKK